MSGTEARVMGGNSPARCGRPRLRVAVVLTVTLAVLAIGARPVLENVHAVVPGAVYRSAQLSAERLGALIQAEHVKSVLNLRGSAPGAAWYEDEVSTSERLGVSHVDFRLSARQEVPVQVADQLVRVMEQLPKPLLIHCEGGADRSGLAAALYRYAILHDSPAEAARQLSIRYGHIPLLNQRTASMDQSFSDYVLSRRNAR